MKIAAAQLNPTVGDLDANAQKVAAARAHAAREGADLVVFPELFITGYPPEDLVLKPAFQEAARARVLALAQDFDDEGPGVLLGTIWVEDGKVYNAVVLLEKGEVAAVRYKVDLPNYGVFDEKRVFATGPLPGPIAFRGIKIGVPICEDIWSDEVAECLAECGAELLIVPNGSPFDWKKPDVRLNIAVARVTETELPLIYVNQVGGQDELVFDGGSFALGVDRSLVLQMPQWTEQIIITDWTKQDGVWTCGNKGPLAPIVEGDAAAYAACMLGLHDYVEKNGFPGVVLGLSGGIDSALVAALAVDALGPERVHAVMLPYRYTSKASLKDAADCAEALAIRYDIIPISSPVEGFEGALANLFKATNADITEENLQSRTRGTIIMAISNKFGAMVLTTGNKSEMSVGYATLYGDMNGGFNPIKDLYKSEVYRLARWRNANRPPHAKGPGGIVIPENILTKAPTAELRDNQTDQDSLPPYDALDDILACLVEKEMSVPDIIARGHAPETVKKVERLLYISEYKRRQAAPGVKISSRNFGRDRRYPITNRFRETAAAAGSDTTVAAARSIPRSVAPRADGGEMA
ncbi:MAG TPA: NAD+ synthase [Hyphomicrobiaceae bacterium]|nr:NAD+ synthase [Hyphomicrobiaceae bacterium]